MVLYVIEVHIKFELCSRSHFEKMNEIPKFKSKSMRLRLYPPLTYFAPIIFYSLQSTYAQNLNPIALEIQKNTKNLGVVGHLGFDPKCDPKCVLTTLQLPRWQQYHFAKFEHNLFTYDRVRAM